MTNIKNLTMVEYILNFKMFDIYKGQKYPRINIRVKEVPFGIEIPFDDIKKAYMNNDGHKVFIRCGQTKMVGIIKNSDIVKIHSNIEEYKLNFPWN